jgi:hypothetical protein
MSLFIVAMFTVVDDFQQWLARAFGRGAAHEQAAGTPAPSAVGDAEAKPLAARADHRGRSIVKFRGSRLLS